MILTLAILTGLFVGWCERRRPGICSDPDVLGIATILAAAAAAAGAIGSAAGTVGTAIGGAAGSLGSALGITGAAAPASAASAAPAVAGTAATPAVGGATAAAAPTTAGLSADLGMAPQFEAAMAGELPASSVGTGTVGGTSPLMQNVQKLIQMRGKQGGGEGGGGKHQPAVMPPPPSLQHQPLPPFQVPAGGMGDQLTALFQAMQARRQRLASLGLGGG